MQNRPAFHNVGRSQFFTYEEKLNNANIRNPFVFRNRNGNAEYYVTFIKRYKDTKNRVRFTTDTEKLII